MFGTQTFLQTVRVCGAHPQPLATGAAEPHPQPDDAGAGEPHPQPDDAGAGEPHPQPDDAAPHPTATSSVTVWYVPISLVTVRLDCTGYDRQT